MYVLVKTTQLCETLDNAINKEKIIFIYTCQHCILLQSKKHYILVLYIIEH